MSVASITTLHGEATAQPANLVWEAPPGSRREGVFCDVADALRARPRTWAYVTTAGTYKDPNYLTRAIRHGRLKAFSNGVFEAVTRTVDGEPRVYMRFMGKRAVQA